VRGALLRYREGLHRLAVLSWSYCPSVLLKIAPSCAEPWGTRHAPTPIVVCQWRLWNAGPLGARSVEE
jgi:hypothetical protein